MSLLTLLYTPPSPVPATGDEWAITWGIGSDPGALTPFILCGLHGLAVALAAGPVAGVLAEIAACEGALAELYAYRGALTEAL